MLVSAGGGKGGGGGGCRVGGVVMERRGGSGLWSKSWVPPRWCGVVRLEN